MINKEKILEKLRKKINLTINLYELNYNETCQDCKNSKAIYSIKFSIKTKKNKFYNKYLYICNTCLINLLNYNL